MLYTYCFLSASEGNISLPPGFKGDLKRIEDCAIAAVVEPELPREELEEDDEKLVKAVIHHDWVICEIFQTCTVLPLRFGTYFPGESDLRSHLATNGEKYQHTLEKLSGKMEVTLKLTPIPFTEKSTTSAKGKAYLRAKKQRYQEQNQYQAQQKSALEQFQKTITQTYPQLIHGEPQENTERFYLLLEAGRFSSFSEQIQQWKNQLQTWTIEVSDPLPPYHFL
jgi:hypothetical protein